jgi:hypothetical protein
MAVDIPARPDFDASPPRPLFPTRLRGGSQIDEYRVTADGQRFCFGCQSAERSG